ncbi:Mrp/NBP35 family ATP-binding protein [Clostridium gasigenes]|uniref:Iron-sulfur cluster carrier protein n=1 Tax=Clostridium gasigenes TaxID=94869 RepID=A0A1H0T8J6_9CLOT|nr:Mrp/NBP35 family ATP-binding protein [Clostridium gasigenes]MBB6623712.1 Mrp/NBP35 family ATP-binding protein [Clostridium gasigenes]MBU3088844.1 Mrp/NBP35 family ATP-binding protein [Clostridium gasigenes]MBU3109273.1 Mrp/NBP35 family ATP-binding protein [Clostridium gasigenes]MBU3134153.1 Mrp/NBP35 family ATP-binding protein [Clostridium gasigenes]NKF08007.1 Mrp/NBP35 family ATP-binding protein [Clostridium gasigenes]
MSDCSSCPSKDSCSSKETNKVESCGKVIPNYGDVKNIIGVISGKGGVGKSTVTGILASILRKKGYKVGVLDADITGPSMPRFFGINKERAKMRKVGEDGVEYMPVSTKSGIKIMSMNLLIPIEDEPVIWRGPVVTSVLTQMFTDTNWGELDYLLIDMPPGTSDVTLTIMQSFPISEMVVVATPQDMVSMIVKKAVVMANKMNVKVRGVIENMAYISCPGCNTKMKVFSKKSSEEHAEYLGLNLLGELPINLDLTEALEAGIAEEYVRDNDLYSLIFEGLY